MSIQALGLVYSAATATRNPLGTAGIGTLLEGAILYLLGSIARDCGVKQEKRLFERWGGPPSTRILRHNNSLVDALTKARLKTTLQTICGLTFPSEVEERVDPTGADLIYSSAIKALLEQRRETKKFRLIFNENCNYGFARNLYGIRWLGTSVASICMATDGLMFYVRGFSFLWALSVSLSIGTLLLLAIYINADFVRGSADAYAVALLRSCEPQKARKPPKNKEDANVGQPQDRRRSK